MQDLVCFMFGGDSTYTVEGEGEGEVVGGLERCAGGRRYDIPVLYGGRGIAVRRGLGGEAVAGRPPYRLGRI